MPRKTITVFSLCVILVISLFSAYEHGRWTQAKDAELYLDQVRKLDGKLMNENADTSFTNNLEPGKYVLEIHSPTGVTKEDLDLNYKNGVFSFRAPNERNANIKIQGDVIQWSWDLGYSGEEYFIGHISKKCIIGNVYVSVGSGEGIARWIIRL